MIAAKLDEEKDEDAAAGADGRDVEEVLDVSEPRGVTVCSAAVWGGGGRGRREGVVHWEMGEILELLGCQNFEGFQLGIQGRGVQTVGFSLHEQEIFKVRGFAEEEDIDGGESMQERRRISSRDLRDVNGGVEGLVVFSLD